MWQLKNPLLEPDQVLLDGFFCIFWHIQLCFSKAKILTNWAKIILLGELEVQTKISSTNIYRTWMHRKGLWLGLSNRILLLYHKILLLSSMCLQQCGELFLISYFHQFYTVFDLHIHFHNNYNKHPAHTFYNFSNIYCYTFDRWAFESHKDFLNHSLTQNNAWDSTSYKYCADILIHTSCLFQLWVIFLVHSPIRNKSMGKCTIIDNCTIEFEYTIL